MPYEAASARRRVGEGPPWWAGWMLLGGLAGCRPTVTAPITPPTPEVSVSRPVSREIQDYADFTGRTAAVETVEVRARVTGYLDKVAFGDGEEVAADSVLYEIDPRPYQASLAAAEADVNRWQSQLAKAKADLARAQKLAPSGAISKEDLDGAVAAAGIALASLEGSKAAVERAQLDLTFTKVTAPIAGRLSVSNRTRGNLITPTESEPLTTIISVDPMYVYFDVDERALLAAQADARKKRKDARPQNVKELKLPVFIGLATETGHPREGLLDFVDNRVNTSTGTIRARAVFENASRYLTPGLFVRVRLRSEDPRMALLVSERAVGIDQGQRYVYVVNADKRVEYRRVELGRRQDDGLRVITSGLESGDLVIVNGMQRVRPGVEVDARTVDQVSGVEQAASAPGNAVPSAGRPES